MTSSGRPAARLPAEPLSEREREILALLAENRSSQEIAGRLHLAVSTVKWYLRQMYAKLGVNDRREAVAQGRLQGLLGDAGVRETPHNLPAPVTPFVGRKAETAAVVQLLTEPATRLLTLLGPGGSGKTRLALQVATVLAEQAHPAFRDGIWFVPLAALQDAEPLVQAIAGTARVVFLNPAGDARSQLRDYFRRRQVLLILDNFEQLVGAQSLQLVSELLSHAPGMKILATSRARLSGQGEQLFHVEGLSLPPIGRAAGVTAAGYSALELFAQCARRLQPGLELDPAGLAASVAICQAVQGMPLGIELAAAWLEVLPPQAILAEIQKSIDFLRADWLDAPQRHHSLRSVFDASWKLLAPGERAAMLRLSLFPSSFSAEAAERAAGAAPEVLRALVHKSWLARQSTGRFQIHELLRQYAQELLQADHVAWESAQDAHAGYFCQLLQRLGEKMKGREQLEAFDQVGIEFESVRSAWQWLTKQGRVDVLVENMLPALALYCAPRWRGSELRTLIAMAQAVLGRSPAGGVSRVHAAILTTAELLFYFGDGLTTVTLVTYRGHQLHQLPEDKVRFAWTTLAQGALSQLTGYWRVMAAALYCWRVSLEPALNSLWDDRAWLAQQPQPWLLALTNQQIGALLSEHPALAPAADPEPDTLQPHRRAQAAQGRQVLGEALARFEMLGDCLEQARTRMVLGELQEADELEAAGVMFEAARQLYEDVGAPGAANFLRLKLAFLHFVQGRSAEGFAQLHQLRERYEASGDRRFVSYALSWESIQAVRFGDLGRAREARETCLQIMQETGDDSYAWALWELGEIERVEGDADGARRHYEAARQLFDQQGYREGLAFYQRGLGDLALTHGDYNGARQAFQLSLDLAQEVHHTWASAYAHWGLGWAAIGLGQLETARRHVGQALRLARDPGLATKAVAGLARLQVANGAYDEAVALSSFVIHCPAAWNETKRQAQKVLEEATHRLPAEHAEKAVARGEADTLQGVIGRWLQP
jgi:predicted ATPase/DNA-binding CsgD family transcriptional regulator/predicted negative regulator of RcsB-dependent stress response